MHTFLVVFQIIVSVSLILIILVQNKDGGLSAVMGGSGESFQSTKRGAEKVMYWLTIVLGFLFLLNALLFLFV